MKNISGTPECWIENNKPAQVSDQVEAEELPVFDEEVKMIEETYEKLLQKYNKHKSKTLGDSLVSVQGALRILKN